jgi:hypothetical protein
MRANAIDLTKSTGGQGATSFKTNWERDSFFVSTVAWFDLILGCSIMFFFPSLEVLGVGVTSTCFSTAGIFGAYAINLKAIRIFHFWKIIFAFGISAFVICIACDAKQVCLEYLSGYEISNCQAKLGLLAIFSLIVDTFFAAYCVFVIKRFAKKIPHYNLTKGCRTRCIDTSYLQKRRLRNSSSDFNLQRRVRRTSSNPSIASSCRSDDSDILRQKKRRKPSDVSSLPSSCSSRTSPEYFGYGTFPISGSV